MARRRRGFTQGEEEAPPKFSTSAARKAMELFGYIKPYKWTFLFSIVLLGLSSTVFMVFPIGSGEIINVVTGKGEYGFTLDQIGMGLLVILVVQSVISFLRVMMTTYVSEHAMADIRGDLFRKLITFPITFFEENRVGELTSRTTNDVQQLQDTLSLTSIEFLRQIIVLALGITYLIYKTPDLALFMFATFPVIVVLALFIGKYIRRLSRERQEVLAETNVILDETLQSIQVVKTFTNEWFELNRYRERNGKVVNLAMKLGLARSLFIAFVIAILFGAIFYVLWRGAMMVQAGEMAPGDLISFIVITAIIGGSMGSLGDLYTQILRAIGASERIMELLSTEGEVEATVSVGDRSPINGEITLKNMSFSYPSRADLPVLEEIDLAIQKGQKIALVGGSGAGKSTIVQLILRLYAPQSGQILLDGKDVQEMDLASYRQHFAIVPQEVMLFGGTIRDNIRYGNILASEEDILLAAEQSNSMEFIQQFPEGLDTIVGDRGIKLSGGQRQRIAIARAILRDPSILILDEATSSLDAESEMIVQEALNRLLEGRTAIIIAHRLATIRNVDRIYVLEHGRIVESGSHQELTLMPEGRYNQLARLQFDMTTTS
ncbi:MAG: ATP-binding cassette domain-containing protein [Saprospiraceae bacterium]|nr:ATP-binding cassette domain-containing protein [Saprospiraceae bacterium]